MAAAWQRLALALAVVAVLAGVPAARAACPARPSAVPTDSVAPWWNCTATSCTAVCRPENQALPLPASTCVADAWSTPSPAGCRQSCPGLPPSSLLPAGATFDAACAGTTVNAACRIRCASGAFGSPTVSCLPGRAWASSISGRCSDAPVCTAADLQSKLSTIASKTPNSVWNVQACADTSIGGFCNSTCTGTTLSGTWASPSPPAVQCVSNGDGGATWDASAIIGATCSKACVGPPPAALLPGGNWDNCALVMSGSTCSGTCRSLPDGFYGSATITCTPAGVWDTAITGACIYGGGCLGAPSSVVTNGQWKNCNGLPLYQTCVASCASGYGGTDLPTAACDLDLNSISFGTWSNATGACRKV